MMEGESHSVVSNSLWLHGLYTPWSSPGQHTGVGSLSFLQGIFPTQGLNPGLPHCRWILYQLGHQGSTPKSRNVALKIQILKLLLNLMILIRSSLIILGLAGKESACNVGDLDSIPGLGRSPGEGKDYPLQYSGLENSMDCIVHGLAKSQIQLSNFHFHT